MRKRYILTAILILALLFAGIFLLTGSSGELKTGDPAPDFDLVLLSGETVRLSDFQGKAVLLNFWATWCPPCIAEMPDIQRISEKFAGDAVVLAVNYSETHDMVSRFIAENGYMFYVGLDPDGAIAEKYPTDGIPYTLIIDRQGVIAAIHLGGGEGMFSVFEKDLDAILNK